MYKRFLNKIIGENAYPRCHYTRKKHRWKPKVPYVSLQAAELFIEERELENYVAYRCPVCGKWHIGFKEEKSRTKPSEMGAFIMLMKLKIKIKTFGDQVLPEIISKGDWIDLRVAEEYVSDKEEYKLLKLGIAMQLPKGFEAVVAPRSSTFKNWGVLLCNSLGIIDNSYSGDNDEWRFPAYFTRRAFIHRGDRICQFRIQLSQKATFWQKIKWLLSSGIKIEKVEKLNTINRGGIGSTGKK